MSYFRTIFLITFSVILFLNIFGLIDGSASQILSSLNFNDIQNFKIGEFFNSILTFTTGVGAVTGIVVAAGALLSKDTVAAFRAVVAFTLTGWAIGDLIILIQKANELATGNFAFLATIIQSFSAFLMLALGISAIMWVGGSD